jgi:hypothetical protein
MRRDLFEGIDTVVVDVPREELLPEGHPGPAGSARIAAGLSSRLSQRNASR